MRFIKGISGDFYEKKIILFKFIELINSRL